MHRAHGFIFLISRYLWWSHDRWINTKELWYHCATTHQMSAVICQCPNNTVTTSQKWGDFYTSHKSFFIDFKDFVQSFRAVVASLFYTHVFLWPCRLTPDQKYLVVTQLNINQITLLEAPPVGIIGQCQVVSTIQLADDVKPHLVDLDQSNGDLYVAEIGAGQAQKFIPMNTGSV